MPKDLQGFPEVCKWCSKPCGKECPYYAERKALEKSLLEEMNTRTLEDYLQVEMGN